MIQHILLYKYKRYTLLKLQEIYDHIWLIYDIRNEFFEVTDPCKSLGQVIR